MFNTKDIDSQRFVERVKMLLERSTDPHNIYTPLELCQEVISKVPSLDGKVLIIANMEFVYTLKRMDVPVENIHFATPCPLKAMAAKSLLAEHNVFVYNGVITKKDVGDMKFDVVVGNPPYQEGSRADAANKLWPRFVQRGWELVAPNGHLAMITPNSWLTPAADIGKGRSGFSIYRDIFQRYQVEYANIDSDAIKKHFPQVGSTFSWFVVNNTNTTKATDLTTSSGDISLDLQEHGFLPVILTPESFSIMEKFTTDVQHFDMLDQNHEVMSDKINGEKESSKEQSARFKYPNFHTPAKGGQYRYSSRKHSNHDRSKVMISLSGKYEAKPDNGTMGYTGMCLVLLTENANNAANVLNSKLYRFVVHNTKFFGFNPRHMILKFPAVDLTRSWTDEELYAHFNLTEEEIKLIEDTIK